jgi:pimeloyl-ACP methyl ester carboxylesterase
MLEDRHGPIDYCEQGKGTTIVFVPGSWATRSSWSGIVEALGGRFRIVTTSLPGYGGTRESRTAHDCAIDRSSETVEVAIRRAGGPVHLVGHSYGAMVCLDLALCGLVPLVSLTLIEPLAFGLLYQAAEYSLYEQFMALRADYTTSFEAGNTGAAQRVVDYLDRPGRFATLPPGVREQIIETTRSHIFDMGSAFDPTIAALSNILLPTRVVRGERTAQALHKCADILSRAMGNASLHTIAHAGHFVTATYAPELAKHIADHVMKTESLAWSSMSFASPFGLRSRNLR